MAQASGRARTIGLVVIVAGVVFAVAGVVTWFVVADQLAAEHITVSEDARFLAGTEVNGPFAAYSQAQVINKHALEATGGKTAGFEKWRTYQMSDHLLMWCEVDIDFSREYLDDLARDRDVERPEPAPGSPD